MTEADLREIYTEGVKIIRAEKRMRVKVFEHKPTEREAKVAEMDRLEEILTKLKDMLKPHCEPVMEQAPLLDVPAETKGKERRAEFS